MFARIVLPLLLALALPVAGCFGSDAADPAAPAPEAGPGPSKASGGGSTAPDVGPDGRPHTHDSWAGRTEVTLVDAAFTPNDECIWIFGVPNVRTGCILIEMGNGSVVYQGTDKVTLTATWSDATVPAITMWHRDAAGEHAKARHELASGAPATIQVTPSTADLPHSSTSRWAFHLALGGAGVAHNPLPKVHVVVTIHRGLDLPLDPPHPDFWENGTTREIGPLAGTLQKTTHQFLVFGPVFDTVDLPSGGIVPPGTGSIVVNFTYAFKDPAPGVKYGVVPYYRTAKSPEWHEAADVSFDPAGGAGSFTIPVEGDMVDSPYTVTSQWVFTLYQYQAVSGAAGDTVLPTSWFGGGGGLDRDIDYTWHMVLTQAT